MVAMKRNLLVLIAFLTVSIVAYGYAEYWKHRYEIWYEIESYKESSWLRVSLLEKYAEDCEKMDFADTLVVLNANLEMYEQLASEVPKMPFVNGKVYRDKHLERIKNIQSRISSIKGVMGACKSI